MQSERKIHADINQARDGWIQVTLSGDGAADLTEAQIEAALSAQVQDMAEVSPEDYMRRHDAAIAAYEANTPNDYRYSALALRKAVDAAFAVAISAKQESGE